MTMIMKHQLRGFNMKNRNICDITEEETKDIKAQYANGAPLHMIAEQYHVFTSEIYELISSTCDNATEDEMIEELEFYA
jgi:hypothetical protein